MTIKCGKCGGTDFVELSVGQVRDKSGDENEIKTYEYDSTHMLKRRYEYICYACNTKLTLSRP